MLASDISGVAFSDELDGLQDEPLHATLTRDSAEADGVLLPPPDGVATTYSSVGVGIRGDLSDLPAGLNDHLLGSRPNCGDIELGGMGEAKAVGHVPARAPVVQAVAANDDFAEHAAVYALIPGQHAIVSPSYFAAMTVFFGMATAVWGLMSYVLCRDFADRVVSSENHGLKDYALLAAEITLATTFTAAAVYSGYKALTRTCYGLFSTDRHLRADRDWDLVENARVVPARGLRG